MSNEPQHLESESVLTFTEDLIGVLTPDATVDELVAEQPLYTGRRQRPVSRRSSLQSTLRAQPWRAFRLGNGGPFATGTPPSLSSHPASTERCVLGDWNPRTAESAQTAQEQKSRAAMLPEPTMETTPPSLEYASDLETSHMAWGPSSNMCPQIRSLQAFRGSGQERSMRRFLVSAESK